MTMNFPCGALLSSSPRACRRPCPTATSTARVRAKERGFEILMRRHNQRLYRTARAIVQDEVEVEDVLQQAYLNAFAHLDQFEARLQLSTPLTRIVINEAAARRRSSLYGPATCDGESSAALAASIAAIPAPSIRPTCVTASAAAGSRRRQSARAVSSRLHAPGRRGVSTSETGLGLGLGDEVVKTNRIEHAR